MNMRVCLFLQFYLLSCAQRGGTADAEIKKLSEGLLGSEHVRVSLCVLLMLPGTSSFQFIL